ncbi:MAG: fatty acid desaturase family protein [Bryobacteraceae bacterium]
MSPRPDGLYHLQPNNALGLGWVAVCCGVTGGALALSSQPSLVLWFAGQLLLAFALVQWFVILHEAGHGTLFRSKWLHAPVGHLAGFFAMIPFHSWKLIHGRHHKWTGYQDLDPTTEALVPRQIKPIERVLVNVCWAGSIPLFSVLYRIGNFWNAARLNRMLTRHQARTVAINIAALISAYAALAAIAGPLGVLRFAGAAVLMGLAIQDPLILSQHTHLPQRLSQGRPVQPFPALEQEVFTRSLRLPKWISAFLLHFDAHELHHMYPFVPGYYLHRLDYRPRNEVDWLRWLRRAKQLPGVVFLFQNRHQTGFDL